MLRALPVLIGSGFDWVPYLCCSGDKNYSEKVPWTQLFPLHWPKKRRGTDVPAPSGFENFAIGNRTQRMRSEYGIQMLLDVNFRYRTHNLLRYFAILEDE